MTMNHWWSRPERACADDYRYSELLLANGPGTSRERERMAKACRACTVYLDCMENVIAAGKAWEYHEIQAGLAET
jgi:hypothetical protein